MILTVSKWEVGVPTCYHCGWPVKEGDTHGEVMPTENGLVPYRCMVQMPCEHPTYLGTITSLKE